MKSITDQTYLRDQQYKSPDNLEARINLHQRFRVNSYPWQRWVFDHMALVEGMSVLELGSGTGELWRQNLDRIPPDIFSILGDFSIGMVNQARDILSKQECFRFLCLDAQKLPARSASFDVVIANHMLYHVPDIQAALTEIWNILKPGGRLYAATNGIGHMIELHNLIKKFGFDFNSENIGIARFSLESAPKIVGLVFSSVETRRYIDHLEVTEVEPLIDYIMSMKHIFAVDDINVMKNLKNYVTSMIRAKNYYRISKSQGLVIGIKGNIEEST
jgi:ubiquinone/menaquinone biosynthesis C-methylase UbiE